MYMKSSAHLPGTNAGFRQFEHRTGPQKLADWPKAMC